MQQALEALETWERMAPQTTACAIRIPAIAALREALAQPATMRPAELAERLKRGEKWSLGETKIGCVQHDCDECAQLREQNTWLDAKLAEQDAMLERQTARIVGLQDEIRNLTGEE
jgi:hypothetical protein